MPYVMSRIDVPNVEEWRRAFETATAGGNAAWRRHRIYGSLEEPDQLVVALEVDSYEEAVVLRAGLPESRPFAEVRFAGEPRIVEELDDLAGARDGEESVLSGWRSSTRHRNSSSTIAVARHRSSISSERNPASGRDTTSATARAAG
jgi:hypothetical protein